MGIASHLRCDQVVEIASDYLERALAAHDSEQLEQHLLICGACAEYVAQLREVLARTAQLGAGDSDSLDTATETQLLTTLRRWKQGAGP